jgi:hypothetical protein
MSWLAFSNCKLCVFILRTYYNVYLDIFVIHMGKSFLRESFDALYKSCNPLCGLRESAY